jgi:hypothetical protein
LIHRKTISYFNELSSFVPLALEAGDSYTRARF